MCTRIQLMALQLPSDELECVGDGLVLAFPYKKCHMCHSRS